MTDAPGVCLYTESPEPSGVGAHMVALAARLRDRYRLHIACPPGRGGDAVLARATALGLPALAVPDADARPDFVRTLVRDQGIRLVHLHAGIAWEGHDSAQAAREADARVLRTEHLPYLLTDPDQREGYVAAIDHVDRVLCVSDGARQSFAAEGVPADKLCAVPNGIPDPGPAPADGVRAELGLGPDDALVLTVGRFTPQKAYDVWLDAVGPVLDAAPHARLVWVGDGPLWTEIRDEVERRGLGDRVRLVGRRGDVPRLMAAADLFVLPSRFEGLPLVVLEALAAGLPVVATRVVGSEEAVRDGETGRLVPPEDAASLADAVAGALADDDGRARWAGAARADFEARWTDARMADDTAAVYDDLLSTPR